MGQMMSYEEFLEEVKKGGLAECGSCPVTPGLTLFQGKWTSHVLYALCARSPIRFGELRRVLPGITNTTLTAVLKELETEGIVRRRQFNEIPPHVEYSFTQKGRDLLPIFYARMSWGVKYESDYYGDSGMKKT